MGIDCVSNLSLTIVLATVVGTTSACGAVAEDPPPPPSKSPPGFWPAGATEGPIAAALGEAIDVPGGFVREGYWKFRTAQRALVAGGCDESNVGLRTYRLRVAPFRLMRFEVSNRVYGSCVSAGRCKPPDADLSDDPFGKMSWDDPSRADRPAAASQIAARGFCRAHGGDLPTYYQWVRAAEGDEGAFGIKALTETWVRCELGEVLPLCDALRRATWLRTSRPPAGYQSIAALKESTWDVGPFGHAGLFGGAGEWIRVDNGTRWFRGDCSSENLLTDNYIQASYESPPDERITLMQLGRDLDNMGSLTAPDAELIASVQEGSGGELAGKGRYFTGFRCAFPPSAAP